MTREIYELARGLGQGETEALLPLCRAAEDEVRGWLRAGVRPEDCPQAFRLAAAWVALAGLALAEGGGVERFTAGGLTIQERGGEDAQTRAETLRRRARQVLGAYAGDEGFLFQGVRG